MDRPLFDRMWQEAVRVIGREPGRPFGLADSRGFEWHVSADVFRRLAAHKASAHPVMFGIPIQLDDELAPDTARLLRPGMPRLLPNHKRKQTPGIAKGRPIRFEEMAAPFILPMGLDTVPGGLSILPGKGSDPLEVH